MTELIGVKCFYYSLKPGKKYTNYAELLSNYNSPELVGCIFDEHPNQKTMKKMGWVSELQDGESIISVPYDLHDLQVGALFILPSGIDFAKGRLFRVTELSTTMIYPSSITCKIVPQYEDSYDRALLDHSTNSFNLLEEEDMGDLR